MCINNFKILTQSNRFQNKWVKIVFWQKNILMKKKKVIKTDNTDD